ncbi:methionine/alanine import family NSS transporter small subunit [Bogoriella caseilytica]|uniref:Putative methionine/alanine importer small subunit n=1 Tax=Bogoriella caseilytica TaxID=56055 RepID=A0A3N2BGU1_9MICO|nr:methionine/alanine import family NSS transporter small subunit [Bogoriella caseilytica]ROR74466.1 putative methionine/alanine importer small subunit [Bogoriella caseilytica]
MSTAAILMMIVAVLIVGGGLVASIIYLLRHPVDDVPDGDAEGKVPPGSSPSEQ